MGQPCGIRGRQRSFTEPEFHRGTGQPNNTGSHGISNDAFRAVPEEAQCCKVSLENSLSLLAFFHCFHVYVVYRLVAQWRHILKQIFGVFCN